MTTSCCLAPPVLHPLPHLPRLELPFELWDAHMHVHALPGHKWDSPPERALAVMEPVGISRAVIMPYSEIDLESREQLEIDAGYAAAHPGRFLLFARLHPGEGGGIEELLEYAVTSLGYVGLKLHPVGSRIAPTDPRTVSLVRCAARLGLPVLFHCGDETLTLPDDIGPLAEKVPEANILLGHCGGYFHTRSALEWAQRCPNLYFETSATPDVRVLKEAFHTIGPHRLIWGSDGPGCLPYLEVFKMLLALEGYESSTQEVFRDTLRRLLTRLPETPPGPPSGPPSELASGDRSLAPHTSEGKAL